MFVSYKVKEFVNRLDVRCLGILNCLVFKEIKYLVFFF